MFSPQADFCQVLERPALTTVRRLFLVGIPWPPHVGWSLIRAAQGFGLEIEVCNSEDAFRGFRLVQRTCWWMLGRRPAALRQFSRQIVHSILANRPDWVLTTGLAPLDARAVQAIREAGIRLVNYSTDDPWNRAQSGEWFRRTLSAYHTVFSPRRSNAEDFRRAGCADVRYLPFAYDPRVHFIERPAAGDPSFACDVVFIGGADPDRLPLIRALLNTGLEVHLWGGYWTRLPEFHRQARGYAEGGTLRKAISGASIVLCLVRRANRDGHVMRSFEVPAMGGCMLTEDTAEHREIFDEDGDAVVYFRSIPEMVERTQWLLNHKAERRRLASAAHARITKGKNTYADRLQTMLEFAGSSVWR